MSALRSGGHRAGRRAGIIVILGLAVVASVFLAAQALSHHPVRPADPVAPLVGVIDRAKATAGAANGRAAQLNGETGSTVPGDASPTNPFGP